MKIYIFLILLFTQIISNINAQQISSREKALFKMGVELYSSKQFKAAEKNFALIVDRLPNNRFITANYLMLAKTQYKLDNFISAINLTKAFLHLYPESSYSDDIFLVQGDCYYRLKRFESGINSWLHALEGTDDYRMEEKLKDRIFCSLVNYFSREELVVISTKFKSPDGKLALHMATFAAYVNEGKEKQAQQILKKSLSENSRSKFYADAQNLLSNKNENKIKTIRIALLLPLSGINQKIAREIQEGVELAVAKFNSQHKIQIEIVLKDYGQDLSASIFALKEIAADNSIVAVFGPIENDFAAACAAISEYEKLPVFSPTATGNDLTKLSKYFNQLNNPVDTQAEFLARFALDSLGIKRFATFSPVEDHFVKLVDKFVKTCEESGAEIVGQEWYYPDEQDFFKKFMNLKRKGLKLAFADSVLSTVTELTDIKIDSLYKEYLQDQIEKSRENFAKIDSADIPITTIEGLFVPIYQEDLKFIAPQIAYSNIQSQILGNGDWYNPDELKKHKNYIDGIIFLSDGYLNKEDWDYKKFRNDFRTRTKKTPTKFNLIGYDTFNYILQYFNNTSKVISRREFVEIIKNNKNFKGIYRKIKLTDLNYNSKVQLIKYKYGQFLPLN